jgi:hypothetical protein
MMFGTLQHVKEYIKCLKKNILMLSVTCYYCYYWHHVHIPQLSEVWLKVWTSAVLIKLLKITTKYIKFSQRQ